MRSHHQMHCCSYSSSLASMYSRARERERKREEKLALLQQEPSSKTGRMHLEAYLIFRVWQVESEGH